MPILYSNIIKSTELATPRSYQMAFARVIQSMRRSNSSAARPRDRVAQRVDDAARVNKQNICLH